MEYAFNCSIFGLVARVGGLFLISEPLPTGPAMEKKEQYFALGGGTVPGWKRGREREHNLFMKMYGVSKGYFLPPLGRWLSWLPAEVETGKKYRIHPNHKYSFASKKSKGIHYVLDKQKQV